MRSKAPRSESVADLDSKCSDVVKDAFRGASESESEQKNRPLAVSVLYAPSYDRDSRHPASLAEFNKGSPVSTSPTPPGKPVGQQSARTYPLPASLEHPA
jgi:hypothetical protein